MTKGYAHVIEDVVEHYNNASPPIPSGALLLAILDAASHTQTTADEDAVLGALLYTDVTDIDTIFQNILHSRGVEKLSIVVYAISERFERVIFASARPPPLD